MEHTNFCREDLIQMSSEFWLKINVELNELRSSLSKIKINYLSKIFIKDSLKQLQNACSLSKSLDIIHQDFLNLYDKVYKLNCELVDNKIIEEYEGYQMTTFPEINLELEFQIVTLNKILQEQLNQIKLELNFYYAQH
jgi:hypothetical protein